MIFTCIARDKVTYIQYPIFIKESTAQHTCNYTNTHCFIVDSDDATFVGVQSFEPLSERPKHHTALDEVVKFHRVLVLTIEHSRTQVAKFHRSSNN